MTSDPADAFCHHIFSLSLHDHLTKEKPGWPPKLLSALFNHVDWVANGDALRGYPPLNLTLGHQPHQWFLRHEQNDETLGPGSL